MPPVRPMLAKAVHSVPREIDATTPGAQSRWNPTKTLSWQPVRPELVVEVRYEHLQARRFRHTSRLVRFRPDRTPESCTYEQLEEVAPAELMEMWRRDK